jgi:hypothetical protein
MIAHDPPRAWPGRRRPSPIRLPKARRTPPCRWPGAADTSLLRGVGPAQNGVVDDGVLHVHDHAGRRIHRGQFLHRQNALEEAAAAAAVLFGDLDAHQAQLEELADDVLAEDAGFVHFADMRADLLARELAHGGLKELLFFRQRGERLRGISVCCALAGMASFPILHRPVRGTGGLAIPPPRHASRGRCRC